MKIAITNCTGLRNRGCEALVVSLMGGLRRHFDAPLEFELHTNDPSFDRWRLGGAARVRPSYLTLVPDHARSLGLNRITYSGARLAERILPSSIAGYPSRQLSALRSADLVLPTGGDIFTSDYNNLRKHLSSLVSLEKRKAALVGHTIGPFKKDDESYFRRSLKDVFLITARESQTYEYLTSLNLDMPIHRTADLAFGLEPASAEDSRLHLSSRYGIDVARTKLVALSVSEGVIRYSKLDRARYFDELKRFVKRMNVRGYLVLLIPHVMERNPNNNDLIACEELHSKLEPGSACRIIGGEYSAALFKGIIGLCECLIGARTHATIASMSQAVPTVSIAYSRKAYGIMGDVFGPAASALTIAATDLTCESLEEAFDRATSMGGFEKAAQAMKARAEENYVLLRRSFS